MCWSLALANPFLSLRASSASQQWTGAAQDETFSPLAHITTASRKYARGEVKLLVDLISIKVHIRYNIYREDLRGFMAVALSLNEFSCTHYNNARALISCCVCDAVLLCAERMYSDISSAGLCSKKSFYARCTHQRRTQSDRRSHHTQPTVWWSLG